MGPYWFEKRSGESCKGCHLVFTVVLAGISYGEAAEVSSKRQQRSEHFATLVYKQRLIGVYTMEKARRGLKRVGRGSGVNVENIIAREDIIAASAGELF